MSDEITQANAEAASEFIRDNSNKMGKAKAERIYLEEFRKSKKALLYNQAPDGSIADRENYAYAHADYLQILEALRAAVQEEESLRWLMIAAQVRIELWRTRSANDRRG